MKKTTTLRGGFAPGSITLLMLLAVLSLTVLALLSYSTALYNRNLFTRAQAAQTAVQTGEAAAAEKLAALDEALAALQEQEFYAEDVYFEAAGARLQEMGCSWQPEENTALFTVEIDEYRAWQVAIRLLPPGEGARYTLVRQAVRLTGAWQPEEERHFL